MDNRTYYDDFSDWYERDRGHGYHAMIDDLEVSLVRRYGQDRDLLEVGCGTGLLLQRTRDFARRCVGIDLSPGMLAKAKDRSLPVLQGAATVLPFRDSSFDVAYSFKVLAHVENIQLALAEMARVVRPGGFVIAEFYNPFSLRYLVKRLKPPSAISDCTNDEAVFTRYDTLHKIGTYLPAGVQLVHTRGIRIITPLSHLHRIPALGPALRFTENCLADVPILRNLGGFIAVVLQKKFC